MVETDIQKINLNILSKEQFAGITPTEGEFYAVYDAEAGQVIQINELPTPSSTEVGKIYQYVGETTTDYINGYFYKCEPDEEDPLIYVWKEKEVQPSGGSGGDLPDPTGQQGKYLYSNGTDAVWKNVDSIPTLPTTDGIYSLMCIVTDGIPTVQWVSAV